jgi:DNA-binding protein HU-beta
MAGKADIVDEIANKTGVSKKQAADAFEVIINSITKSLKKGERVQLPGFGSFSVSRRDARQGRNPATGETIQIKASKSVRFKMGKDLKDTLN